MRKKRRSAYLLESLEARLLFSADLAPLPVDGGTSGAEFESNLEISLQPDSAGVQEADENTQERQEVIFVDSGVDDYQQLIDDIESQLQKGRQFDIVNLDSDSDGIDQISAYLRQHEGIDAVHVVSHGSEDAVKLGNVWLTPDKLDAYADAIEGWQQALSDDADLLFYGCNLAAGDGGQDLVNSLSLLTDADVAASDDLTGSAQLGGDWVLEYRKGEIETAAAINNEIQQNWNGVLASFTVDTTFDTVDANPGDGVAEDAAGNTSLRAAVMEANALAGADTIFLDAATYTITLNGDTDGTGGLDIRSDLSIVGVSPTQTTINANSVHRVFDVHDEAAHTVSISNLKVENGLSPASVNGAGLLVRGIANRPDVHVDNVWFSDNDASGAGAMGGAISNSADLTVTNSLIEGNSAPEGGGVWNASTGVLTMQNVTLSGNDATVGDGGGLFNEGNATLRHVTVTANSAVGAGGGVIHDNGAVSTDIGNSIIAGNSAASAPDITNTIGNITSSGGNIIQDATGTGSDFAPSEIGIDPLLGGLTDNGGNLMTHAPAAAQAIDAADPTMAPNTDQRGFLRGDGSPDIGAYEAGTSAATTAHYLDQFNAVAYNGNNGSLLWSNDWQEVGEPTDPNFGSVSVWNELGEDGLYIWAADNVGAWRQADLSGATSAVLSFDWAMLKTESGDQARLRISTDGVGWTTLDTFDGPLDHSSMQSASYDISAFIDRDTRIRFETISGFAANDVLFVDNVSIELRTSPPVVANLSPIKDTYLDSNNPTENYGAGTTMLMDESGGDLGEGHVLLQFDLSTIPAGATITGATLKMEAVGKTGAAADSSVINIYEVTEAWDEGSGGSDDATWNNRRTGTPWGTPGGSFDSAVVATLTASATGGHTWDITALVQAWQTGAKSNNGLMLASNDTGGVVFTYDSREGGTPPELVITYSVTSNDTPTLGNNNLTITEGATVTLDSSMLSATDVDNADPSLTFNVSGVTAGHFAFSSDTAAAITSFDQSDITAGTVVFVHDDSEAAPSYSVSVTDGTDSTAAVPATITFTNVNDTPTLGNNNLTITEGATVTLDSSMLSATDVDNADPSLTFNVSGVTAGHFAFSSDTATAITSFDQSDITAGTVVFVHDDSEAAPSYSVSVTDGTDSTAAVPATITFTNVNDAPTLGNNNLTITEGATVTLDSSMLSATDVDNADPSLTFNVSGVTAGHFAFSSDTATAITSFDQSDITAGTVVFVHDDSEAAPSYSVSVTDGTDSTAAVPATITFTNVNDTPTLGNNNLTITEGATVTLDSSMLSATDVDNADPSLTFNVSGVTAGHFAFSSDTATAITSFDQSDITAGTVVFVHDDSEAAPSYSVSVTDGTDSTAAVPATITFTNVNDAPTLGNNNLTITEGATVTLDSSMLSATDVDNADPSLTFNVSGVTAGHFAFSSDTATAITSFDQSDITAGTVVFVHDDSEAAPSYSVSVTDGTDSFGPTPAVINFTNINDPGTVTIDNTTPAQGDTLTANVIDPDGASDAISFQWLSDGAVIGGATGKTYTTTQGDVGAVMTVTAIYTDDQGTAESLISNPTAPVTNVNDTPIAVNDNLNAIEDQSMTFTSVTDLLGNDSDVDGDTLTLSSFSQPANGSLADNGDGTVTYTSAGNFSGVDNFTYTISDNKGGTAAGAAIIVVTPVGDTPQVTNVSTNAEVQSGLINIDRNASDGAEVTHFKISGITNGTLYLADGVTRIDNGDFITVGQGQTGLRFTPAANSTADGGFNVESSEDGASVASQSGIATSTISVLTTAPQPSQPEQSPIQLNTDETVIEETEQEENEDLDDVAEETDVQADTNDLVSVETPQSSKAPGIKKASMVPGLAVLKRADLDSNHDQTPGRSTLLSPQTLKTLIESENLGELKTAFGKLDITTLPPDVYELVRGSLDAVQEEMGKEILIGKTVVGSAIATSVGLSAGYVVWMLKGGSLLASVLSSLPAWQLADPLAILVGKIEDEEEEDDTLETIIKDGSRRNEDKERKASELDKHKKESTKR